MKRKYQVIIAVFALLLLLPFTVQTVVDLQGEKRFRSLDIFKDVVYTPFKRQSTLAAASDTLSVRWMAAREAIAGGAATSDALEPVIGALSDLEAAALTVNAYAELDSSEEAYKLLKSADSLLSALEDEPGSFPVVDSVLKAVISEFSGFSLVKAFLDVKRYGVWTSRYIRAFEKKVEDENALVLAVRPKYQLAVWNLFDDPGEKVVLGARGSKEGEDPWLYYRQDVEFLVQPSPLDVRSAKLDNPIDAIIRFRDQLKAKDVELLVVIVPGKPSIYPEYLTGDGADDMLRRDGSPKFGHGKTILDSLTKLGINTVDLYTPLWDAKWFDERLGSLYLNDDTHWTPRGAELAANLVSEKVRRMIADSVVTLGKENMKYSVSDSVADRMGDIGEMSGLNKFNTFKVQQVTGHVVSPFKDDFRKSKILILGDSFSRIYQTDAPVNAGWIAHFAKNMNRPVASIVSDGGASTLVREKMARKAGVLKGKKLLIWEFVERDLRFGAEGWKDIEF
ncbi:MAG: hypothetical protein MJY85_07060 [Fibrobacter sp.]|nr:hypothetical protein [Fibrobacter sp.]